MGLRVQRQRRAVPGDRGELRVVDVDRDHGGAERRGDLHAVAADTARADDDREAAGPNARATHRLERRGERVGDHRHLGEREAGRGETLLVDRAQAARGDDDVRGEATLDVVAGHLLRTADRREAALAQVAFAAGQYRGHDHGASDPVFRALARGHDAAGDLVAERQRQRRVGAHAVVVVAEVGVAHAAAGNLDGDFARAGRRVERRADERCAGGGHEPAVGGDGHAWNPRGVPAPGRAAPARTGEIGIRIPIWRTLREAR